MRSIGARLALWYGGAAAATLVGVFVAGYYLLQVNLVHGLDLLNSAQFAQIRARLGSDYQTLDGRAINFRIRETTEYASVLFYITVDERAGLVRPVFYSSNLRGNPIPDVPGKHAYDASVPGIGELRAGEFILGPFDVTVATPLASVRETMRSYSRIGLPLLAVSIALSVAIGFGLSRLAMRPVRLIRDTASHIGSDNLAARIPVASVRDEISDLARLLNLMFERLERSFQQIRRFTAEASHELKTPLSLVRLQAEKLLVHGRLSAENEECVHVLLEETARLSQIIEELLFLSRAEGCDIRLRLEPHEPEALLAGFSPDARVLAEHRDVQFECTHAGVGSVLVEPRWLRRVLLNLLTNALNVSPRGGRVALNSQLDVTQWRVSLEDQGPGVAPELRERIFERFFRLSRPEADDEAGNGLGLAICRSIIALHGGTIWAESSPGYGGLRVVFTLPAAAASGSPSMSVHPAAGLEPRREGRRV